MIEKIKNQCESNDKMMALSNIKNPSTKNTVGFKTGTFLSLKDASYGFSDK
jgi:hypothetical protein